MQEEVTRGAVTLIGDGAKLSEQVFEKAVKKVPGGNPEKPEAKNLPRQTEP